MRQINRVASALYLLQDAAISAILPTLSRHILVACMPKSGSTFLTNAIAHYPQFRKVMLAPAYDQREQELCQIRLSRYHNRGKFVSQEHVRNSEWTQRLIAQYGLSPVVLIRDLPDIVVSLRDHVRRESRTTPVAYITQRHAQQSDSELETTLVRLAIPWYLNFYATWSEATNALTIRYEDLIRTPVATIADVLRHANIQPNENHIQQALKECAGGANRLNVGVAGRGKKLSSSACEAMGQLMDEYPEFENDPYFIRIREMLSTSLASAT